VRVLFLQYMKRLRLGYLDQGVGRSGGYGFSFGDLGGLIQRQLTATNRRRQCGGVFDTVRQGNNRSGLTNRCPRLASQHFGATDPSCQHRPRPSTRPFPPSKQRQQPTGIRRINHIGIEDLHRLLEDRNRRRDIRFHTQHHDRGV